MEEFLIAIGDKLIYLYSLMLLASIYVFREFCSNTLSCLIIVASELMMNPLRDPLLEYAVSFEKMYTMMIWYGTWALIYTVFILMMYKTHQWLGLATTKSYRIVGYGFSALVLIQFIGYLDAMYIDSVILDKIYRFSIPSINISMALMMMTTIYKEIKHARSGIHNGIH